MADDFDSPELDVRIKIDADTAGVQAAAQGLDKVADSGKRATGSLSDLRRALGSTRNATAVFEGLERSSQGGVQAIVGLTRAFRGFFMIVAEGVAASGPFGLLIVAIGAIVGGLIALGHHAHEAGDGLTHGKKSADEFGKALKELEKESAKDLKEMEQQVKELTKSYDELLGRMKAADERASKLNKAQQGLEEAQLDLSTQKAIAGATTDEQRTNIQRRADLAKEAIGLKYQGVSVSNEGLHSIVARGNAEEQIRRAEDFSLSEQDRANAAAAEAAGPAQAAVQSSRRALRDSINLGRPGFGGNPMYDVEPDARRAHEDAKAALVGVLKAKDAQKQADAANEALSATIKSAEKEEESADTETQIVEIEKKTLAVKQQALDAAGQAESGREDIVAGKDKDRADKAAESADAQATNEAMHAAEEDARAQKKQETEAARAAVKADREHAQQLQRIFRDQAKAAREQHATIKAHAERTSDIMRSTTSTLKQKIRQDSNAGSFQSTGP